MSTTTPTPTNPSNPGSTPNTTERVETFPKGEIHGNRYVFDITDQDKDSPNASNSLNNHNIPDGSLYQTLRTLWLQADKNDVPKTDDDQFILNPKTTLPFTDQPVAIVLSSSNWVAGQNDNTWYEYHLSLRQVDDGGVTTKTPVTSFNINVVGHYDGLTYSDGNEYTFQTEGSHATLQTTWPGTDPDAHIRRLQAVMNEISGYSLDTESITNHKIANLEIHHRFKKWKMEDVRYVMEQTAALIPHLDGDIEDIDGGTSNGGNWELYGFTSTDWDVQHTLTDITSKLQIKLKTYTSDSETGWAQHPKIEIAITGRGDADTLPSIDAYHELIEDLQSILNSHCIWANIQPEHLVEDPQYGATDNPEHEARIPTDRRQHLQDYYSDLDTEIGHELRRTSTALPYDILRYVMQHGSATYQDLEEHTGAGRSTIRRHVRRMENIGGDDKPGILNRIQSSITIITIPEQIQDTLNSEVTSARPDTPEDVAERREDRKEKRKKNAERPQNQPGEDTHERQDDDWVEAMHPDAQTGTDGPEWVALADTAAPRQVLEDLTQDHIAVNVLSEDYHRSAID